MVLLWPVSRAVIESQREKDRSRGGGAREGGRFLLLHTDHRKSWSRKASQGPGRAIINPGREPA